VKFKIIYIGKIKNSNLFSEITNLRKRISRLEILELKEIKENNVKILQKKEFEEIKKHINKTEYNILLLESKNEFSTKEFYTFLEKNKEKKICFIITGPFGPNNDLKELVDFKLSLSKMTFTSQQAQYLLTEQLYRIECIKKNIPYTK